jgi:hypothetical protein
MFRYLRTDGGQWLCRPVAGRCSLQESLTRPQWIIQSAAFADIGSALLIRFAEKCAPIARNAG